MSGQLTLVLLIDVAGVRVSSPHALIASGVAPHAHAAGELEQYVARPDSSYAWREVTSGHLGSSEYVGVILTSQTWRGIAWKHQLIVFRPSKIDASSKQALLFIDGGRWNPTYER